MPDDVNDALTRLEKADPNDDMGDIVCMAHAHEDLRYISVDNFFKDYL